MAAYGPGPQNLWTQANNTFWNGNTGGDPNCYSSCVQWPYGPNGYFQGTWATDITGPAWFVSDIQQAVADASALPFNSPSFRQVGYNGSCSSVDLCIIMKSPSNGDYCAVTLLPASGTITHAEIDVTPSPIFTDGPTTKGGTCDLRDTMHHEMGHVLGLGHSSSGQSLMWYANNNVENFGTDEHHGLKVIYLDHNDNWTGGGNACNTCQQECADKLAALGGNSASVVDLSNACNEAGIPVPLVGTPVVTATGTEQKVIGAADGYLQAVRSRVP